MLMQNQSKQIKELERAKGQTSIYMNTVNFARAIII